MMCTNYFNIRKEYQNVETTDDIEIGNKDDEEESEIIQNLVDLIDKDEKEKRRNKRDVSLRRVEEDSVSKDLLKQRRSSSRVQSLVKNIKIEILEKKRRL